MKTTIPIILITILFLLTSCQSTSVNSSLDRDNLLMKPISFADNFSTITKVIDSNTTLNDLLSIAAFNNASLKSAYLKWQSELFKVYPAGALPDPHLSYTYYVQEVETRVGAQKNAIALMQKLPWFGKLDLKKAMQQEMAQSKKAEYDAVKNALFSKVEQLYYDYWYLQQSLRIAEENIKLLESLEPISRNKIKVGAGSQDLIKLQIEIAKVTDIRDSLKLRKIPLDARLNQLLNRPARAQVGLIAALGKIPQTWSEKELLAIVKANPELQKYEHLKSAATKKIELAGKNRYPDLNIGLKWIQTNDLFVNTRENGKDPVMATIGFSIPWNQRKYGDLIASAKVDYRAISWAGQEMENKLRAQTKMALYEIEDNLRVLKLYRDTLIPKTEESLNLTLQAYRNGQESFIGFVDIQRQLLNFQLTLEKSRLNIAKQKTIIEEITGHKLSKFGETHE